MSSAGRPATSSSFLSNLLSMQRGLAERVVDGIPGRRNQILTDGTATSSTKFANAAHLPMEETLPRCVRFGPFSLDLKAGESRAGSSDLPEQDYLERWPMSSTASRSLEGTHPPEKPKPLVEKLVADAG